MSNKNEQIVELNTKALLGLGNYVIPIYQRDYAWRNSEISQLIHDIADNVSKDVTHPYYIGTLITYERNVNGQTIYETIDGQQRLTTMTILLSLIKHKYNDIDTSWYNSLNLKFDCRKKSTNALESIFNNTQTLNDSEYNDITRL